MPTLRGWAVLGAGLALLALWYAVGERELLVTGLFLVAALAAAIGLVRLREVKVDTSRRLGVGAVHNGDIAGVTLVLSNRGRSTVRNLTITDEVERLGMASFEIARIRGGEAVSATYRVTCRPRGVYRVGPSRVTVTDPLRLAEAPAPLPGPADRLVVYPTLESLDGFPVVRGKDPSMSASRPEHSQQGGEDFYTLREYQRGDDLRRVHWPSSAKRQELMIRKMETPWRARALVSLDVRASAYESAEAFERAVSGAGSVVTHLVESGFYADLWTGEPQPIDTARYTAAMERLATVQADDRIDLGAASARIRRKGAGGVLVLVTGMADTALLRVQQTFSRDYPTTVLMGATTATPQVLAAFHRLGVATITVRPDEGWAEAWLTAMRSTWKETSAS